MVPAAWSRLCCGRGGVSDSGSSVNLATPANIAFYRTVVRLDAVKL